MSACRNYNIKNLICQKSIWFRAKTYIGTLESSNCRRVCLFIFGHFSIQDTLRYIPLIRIPPRMSYLIPPAYLISDRIIPLEKIRTCILNTIYTIHHQKFLNQLHFLGKCFNIPALSFFGCHWKVLIAHPWACYLDGDQDSNTNLLLGNIQMGKQFLCLNIFCWAMVHWKFKSQKI